ncbi:hypothetical protein RER_58250 [Rhodococcus erythropolis PR4]|uniref:Uncharacterized protein n=1 Tax=Rhodococcus erythropolis (strain PR4 / NBRC 100887) TaxID=234621 RepID=C0ZV39_RHOE4|nr:hypothetical protein RER_58250 [Rhodococcus erythropolis PR4]
MTMCYARVGEIGLSGDGVYEDAWDLTKRLLHETHDRNVRPEYKNILDEMDNLVERSPRENTVGVYVSYLLSLEIERISPHGIDFERISELSKDLYPKVVSFIKITEEEVEQTMLFAFGKSDIATRVPGGILTLYSAAILGQLMVDVEEETEYLRPRLAAWLVRTQHHTKPAND